MKILGEALITLMLDYWPVVPLPLPGFIFCEHS